MNDDDSRDFFRLKDQIHVSYMPVMAKDVGSRDPADYFDDGPAFSLLRDLYELELESAEIQRTLTEQNRPLGSFLANLNKRMEILTRAVSASQQLDTLLPNSEAMISEAGLSFINDSFVSPGQHLALRLIFLPSMLGLTCFARVRHCRLADSDEEYQVGVEFEALDSTNQRLLSRHIIRRQSDLRRERLRQQENGDSFTE